MKKYIDVDLLKSELEDLDKSGRLYYMGVFDVINSQPIVDVKEVRHGKWERRIVEKNDAAEMKSVCSECGKTNKRYEPPYCPHCGAKMEVIQMTDNEIIKAMQCVIGNGVDCTECEYQKVLPFPSCMRMCDVERERLLQKLQQAKSEAIKKFAERLKERYEKRILCNTNILNNEIDNLVKEMTKGE